MHTVSIMVFIQKCDHVNADGNFGNQLWTTGPNQYSSYNTTTTTTAKKQYKPSKKRAKMLTFERVKGRKDGQTRLTFY